MLTGLSKVRHDLTLFMRRHLLVWNPRCGLPLVLCWHNICLRVHLRQRLVEGLFAHDGRRALKVIVGRRACATGTVTVSRGGSDLIAIVGTYRARRPKCGT